VTELLLKEREVGDIGRGEAGGEVTGDKLWGERPEVGEDVLLPPRRVKKLPPTKLLPPLGVLDPLPPPDPFRVILKLDLPVGVPFRGFRKDPPLPPEFELFWLFASAAAVVNA
jgi:hypothetical protein